MSEQRVPRRASGVIRWLGVLALLAGIAAMHAGVFSIETPEMGGSTSVLTAPATHHDSPAMDEHPGPIHVRHGCAAFILAAVAFAIGLMLLGWIGRPAQPARPSDPESERAHRERAPPWTVPTLADLSILRI
ncbi:DUF6153 family protein [Nocardia sp. CDC153]|uniref:DUF6153 family protein n=1 Tax=Nocardia sp. CDC153 TaxID=3112167 RepID=UPI002DBC4CC2|nr:DUF6153 family protein [Nocardia sp. CDC153]MEC3954638.1 DUF6153 family protein [Nocardia sp. CDC153]